MKKKSVLLIMALVITMTAFGIHYSQARDSIGTISFMIGQGSDVQIKSNADKGWSNAKLNQSVYDADIIRTASESRCEVTLSDKSVVRIGENSEFVFSDVTVQEYKKNINSELKKGKIWLNVKTLHDTKSTFQVKTPTAVCAVRGTIYRVDSDSSTTCLVYDGAVDVGPASLGGGTMVQPQTNSLQPVEVPGPYTIPPPYEVSLEDWVRIVQGFQITVRPDGKYAKSRIDTNTDAALDWVQWNRQRDQINK